MRKTTLKFQLGILPKRNTLSLTRVTLIFILMLCFVGTKPLYSQSVGINSTGATPNSSAILDLSTGNAGTLGFLPPTLALTTITAPAPAVTASPGLLIYNTATAGTVPNNVTPGYYYWNGIGTWIRVNDNSTTAQYGYNMQYALGTTDATINTNTPTAMPQMSITFTPVHSVVFLDFTASGVTDISTTETEAAHFKVLVNYGAGFVAPGTIPLVGATTGYGCTEVAQQYCVYDLAPEAEVNGWSCGMDLPIAVTAGTSVTITIYWWAQIAGGTYSYLENNVHSNPGGCNRAMIITD